MNALSEWFAKFFGHIGVSATEAMMIKLVHALLVLAASWWLYRLLKRAVRHRLEQVERNDEAAIRFYQNVIKLLVFGPGLLLAIHMLGIDLSMVFTTGGLFAVAFAFALKNLAENLVSGSMLRFERSIKPGDVLETGGALVRIKKIGFRATIARTKDERDLLIPNSQLIQDPVANFTYRDAVCRVQTTVGVSYSSDLGKVREVLEGVCKKIAGVSTHHAPSVKLNDFGSSSINYKISIWIEDPWKSGQFKSDLNEAIWRALKDAGIVIAIPQLGVHFEKNGDLPGITS